MTLLVILTGWWPSLMVVGWSVAGRPRFGAVDGVDASGKFSVDSPDDGPDGVGDVSEGDAGDADARPAGCGAH